MGAPVGSVVFSHWVYFLCVSCSLSPDDTPGSCSSPGLALAACPLRHATPNCSASEQSPEESPHFYHISKSWYFEVSLTWRLHSSPITTCWGHYPAGLACADPHLSSDPQGDSVLWIWRFLNLGLSWLLYVMSLSWHGTHSCLTLCLGPLLYVASILCFTVTS